MLNVLPPHLLDVLLNRQAELDLQAFPNGVWEREKHDALILLHSDNPVNPDSDNKRVTA